MPCRPCARPLASERDLGEAIIVEKDLQILRELLAAASTSAAAARGSAELQQRRKNALDDLAAHEKAVVVRSLQVKVTRVEGELLAAIRELVAVSGARHPSEVYRRNPQLDRFFHFGIL